MQRVPMEKSVQSPPFDLIDIIVRAGAGAGKTTELTQRVLRLALNFQKKNQRFPNFVVTTFTRKATQELRERLLKEAMNMDSQELVQFVNQKSQLHISTIHGVLSLFLSQYGSLVGLSPDLQFCSEKKLFSNIKSLIRKLSQNDEKFNFSFQELLENFEFAEIVAAFERFAVVKASANRMQAISKQDLLKSRTKMQEQFRTLGLRLADEIRRSESQKAWLDLASHAESYQIGVEIGRFASDVPATRKGKSTPESLLEIREQWKDLLEELGAWNLSDDFIEKHEQYCQLFNVCAEKFFDSFEASKKSTSEISMGDLESLSLQVIKEFPHAAKSFSEKWDYWLIDEYQDTSPIQVNILESLIGNRKSFVVGDPQQSIYLFRGARSEVFAEKEAEVQKNGGVLFSKMKNFRSDPELLQFFNKFFESMGSQFNSMEAKELQFDSSKVVADFIQVEKLENKANSADSKLVEDAELLAALAKAQELKDSGVKAEDICILLRSNNNIQKLAEIALTYNVQLQVHSGAQFYSLPEVRDALGLLRFLVNCHDNINLIQVLRSPYFKVRDQDLADYCQEVRGSYWAHWGDIGNESIRRLNALLSQSRELGIGHVWQEALFENQYFEYAHQKDPSGMREANLWKLIRSLKEAERKPGFSYLDYLDEKQPDDPNTEDAGEAIAVPVIAPQKINVMTVHASKGLQFPHVIVPKAGKASRNDQAEFFMLDDSDEKNGNYFWTLSIGNPEDGVKKLSSFGKSILNRQKQRASAEEERILYVALTRAQKTIAIIWQGDPENNSWMARSRFMLTEGMQKCGDFSYFYRKENIRPKPEIHLAKDFGVEGERFRGHASVDRKNYSVTEMLDSNMKDRSPGQAQLADVEKAVLGVNVHRIFENIHYYWLSSPNMSFQEILQLMPVEFHQALVFLSKDNNGLWLELIKNGHVEYGVSVEIDGKFIQGQIDLWGIDTSDCLWIVDYKTGSDFYVEKAFQQLKIYCQCLQQMKKIENRPVKLAVIYPFQERTYIREPE